MLNRHIMLSKPKFDANTSLLLHCNGSNNSTNIVDEAGKIVNIGGSAILSTTQYKFGGASLKLNGTTDYIYIDDSEDFSFGSGDFTIDFWVYFNSLSTTTGLFAQRNAYNANLSVYSYINPSDKKIYFYYSINGTANVGGVFNTVLATGQWYHVAIVRNSTEIACYINGNKETTTLNISTSSIYNSTRPFSVGAMYASTTFASFTNGYFDEFRISKGIARWTSNFTPKSAEYYE